MKTENRAGYFKNNLSGESAFKSFCPAKLPPDPPLVFSSGLLDLIIKANIELALLNDHSKRIPNVGLFLSMYVRKEALLSSQIEGTQATLEDVLDPTIDQNANRDVSDVINYIKAADFAVARLQELPLCNRLLRETHAVLMQGVRGQEKTPGTFRPSQNWIGGAGSTLKNARYIPPCVDDMKLAMSDLEKYINSEDDLDTLVQAGLVHYQFETIHPFLDGNGRIGRLLITLFLMEKGVLSTPALYISYYLKSHRIEYYDRMAEVRNSGDYEQWIAFFLRAILESSKDAIASIDLLSALHDKSLAAMDAIGTTVRAKRTMEKIFFYLETNPIIEINKTAEALGISFNTVSNTVKRLQEAGILEQTVDQKRNRTFSYKAYLDILRKGT